MEGGAGIDVIKGGKVKHASYAYSEEGGMLTSLKEPVEMPKVIVFPVSKMSLAPRMTM